MHMYTLMKPFSFSLYLSFSLPRNVITFSKLYSFMSEKITEAS